MARKKTGSNLDDSTTGDSACATSDTSPLEQDQEFVRSSTPFPTTDEERLNKYDDNWYLGKITE